MKLVKFADGKYGVRRRSAWSLWMGYEFLDLVTAGLWWTIGGCYFGDCRGTRESALNALAMYDKGQAE